MRRSDLGEFEEVVLLTVAVLSPQAYWREVSAYLRPSFLRRNLQPEYLPSNVMGGTGGVNWPGKDPNVNIQFAFSWMGYDAVRLLKLKLRDGREFSPDFATDSTNYLIKELAAKRIGYKNPVGQPLTMWGNPGKIVGVIQDFHFQSLHESIRPLIIRMGEKADFGSMLVRAEPGHTQEVLANLQAICRRLNPKFPFSYSYIDEEYRKLYQSETLISTLTSVSLCLYRHLHFVPGLTGAGHVHGRAADQRNRRP